MDVESRDTGVGTRTVTVSRVVGTRAHAARDLLAVEEPLEIRLHLRRDGRLADHAASVTMRTPGHDAELAVGWLVGEGIVRQGTEVTAVRHCQSATAPDGARNVIRVWLAPGATVDLERLERHAYSSSSCGVCGRTSIDALCAAAHHAPLPGLPVLDPAVVHALPRTLRSAQPLFDRTGGLHAAALFDADGRLQVLREDVGRHNAVDKVIGATLLAGGLPAHDRLLVVSGRVGFELVQKAAMAGIPVLAAVGAPSSLAVQTAVAAGLTLLGFVRDDRFNVYAGAERVAGVGAPEPVPA